ncbi:F0F1 ATP synthase subunit A, partial [Candidatus Thiomargarita nelsonii]
MAEHEPVTGGPSNVEYIQHHLHNLSIGEGFWTLHLDTFFFALGLAVLLGWAAKKVGDNLDQDNPTGLQNFFEVMFEFVEQQVKDAFVGYNPLIAPLAFTPLAVPIWVIYLMGKGLENLNYLTLVPSFPRSAWECMLGRS